jgi:hypothetical protein
MEAPLFKSDKTQNNLVDKKCRDPADDPLRGIAIISTCQCQYIYPELQGYIDALPLDSFIRD